MDIEQLAIRLHKLNELEQSGRSKEAEKESYRLDEEISRYHIRTFWDKETPEWVICDTLINDRED